MSISSNNIITAADINALKSKVKTEMTERKYVGSVTAYAGTDYDYTVTPAANGYMLVEHFNKNQVPLAAVNSSSVPSAVAKNDPVVTADVAKMLTTVTDLASKRTSYMQTSVLSNTGCSASCTGLCLTGCQGGCKGGCGSDVCQGSCLSTCALFCSSACSGKCDSTCTSTCADDCTGTCSTTCTGTCKTTATGCANCASGVMQI